MLEPPSASLLKTLGSLKLCTPRDLRRCCGDVRRLTRDLPAFDSIWIDALVNSRRVSRFQAQCIEAGHAERLVIGPCVLVERLGGSGFAETFLARHRDSHDVCVLKLTSIAPEQVRGLSERVAKLVVAGRGFAHPAAVMPQSSQVVEWPTPGESRLVTITPHVRGPHLAELLIRRGRFPIGVVLELARQLLEGLAALEARGLVHGDIALSNVRIARRGRAVLLDAGLVPALRPEFSFHTILGPERYDGLAPERISTGSPPTAGSDVYALGCLMWQLLAGRPPFSVGDSLAKLAAHQTQAIGDIRDWVPDFPAPLADLLRRWTAMDPAHRPASYREAAAELGSPTRAGRRHVANFRGEFDRSLPRRTPTTGGLRWPLTVAALFAISGAVVSLSDHGTRSDLLNAARILGHTVVRSLNDSTKQLDSKDSAPPASPIALQDLPSPDAEGRLELSPGGRYMAAEVAVNGTLEIQGDPHNPPRIVIAERSLSVWAERVRIQHVHFERGALTEPNGDGRTQSLLIADCRQLELQGCHFDLDVPPSVPVATRPAQSAAAIAWRPQDERRRTATRIVAQDVVIAGEGAAMYLHWPPSAVTLDNVLKFGGGDCLQLRDPGGMASRCELRQVTLRKAASLLRWWPRRDDRVASSLTLLANGCVFDLVQHATGDNPSAARPALVAWMSQRLPPNWNSAIEWELSGTLISSESVVAAVVDSVTGRPTPVDETRLNIEGLVAAPFEFVGAESARPRDSELKSFEAPLTANTRLGIQSERLPIGHVRIESTSRESSPVRKGLAN